MTAAAWALALAAGSSLAAEPRREAVVLPPVENMYSAPDATRDVVSQATIGQVVAVIEVAEGFARIETPDRYRGWVPLSALLEYADSSTPRYATKGTVAEVVSLVYRVDGRILPRDADLQFEDPKARSVERAELRAGDLVFFGKKAVTHVGLYLGDGTFINATTQRTPAVRVDRLDDPYWAELYRGARRIP